ncbi:MAG: 3-oxoacyl-[acyl-carrier-protein] synthase III C-terminal domain-containing protein [Sciscionella sp.]
MFRYKLHHATGGSDAAPARRESVAPITSYPPVWVREAFVIQPVLEALAIVRVEVVQRYLEQMLDELGAQPDPDDPVRSLLESIELIVQHQVNKTMILNLAARAGLSAERLYFNIETMGNVSTTSIPIAVFDAARRRDHPLDSGLSTRFRRGCRRRVRSAAHRPRDRGRGCGAGRHHPCRALGGGSPSDRDDDRRRARRVRRVIT